MILLKTILNIENTYNIDLTIDDTLDNIKQEFISLNMNSEYKST